MSTLKLHYESWLALPAGFRQKLGLKSGDRLEAELAGGTITLRPAGQLASRRRQPCRRCSRAAGDASPRRRARARPADPDAERHGRPT
jgi:AbrB family looped-hinge helix DNA binding protein